MIEDLTLAPLDEEAATIWAQGAPLDLTRELAELADTFPSSVRLNFVGYNHDGHLAGTEQEKYQTYQMGVQLGSIIGSSFPQVDYVCFELAAAEGMAPNKVRQIHTDIARDAHRIRSGEAKSTTDIRARSGYEWHKLDVVVGAIDAGATEDLQIMPVDAYDDEAIQELDQRFHEHHLEMSFYERCKAQAEVHFRRELHVLRQVHELANALAQDGDYHEIVILQGGDHTLSAVAAAELGAPVSRLVIDSPQQTLGRTLERRMRTTPEALSQQTIDLYEEAYRIGMEIDWLRRDKDTDIDERLQVVYKAQNAALGSLLGMYSNEHTQATFDQMRMAINDQSPELPEIAATWLDQIGVS